MLDGCVRSTLMCVVSPPDSSTVMRAGTMCSGEGVSSPLFEEGTFNPMPWVVRVVMCAGGERKWVGMCKLNASKSNE